MLTLAVGLVGGLCGAVFGAVGAFARLKPYGASENDPEALRALQRGQGAHAAAIESLQARYAQVEAWVEDVNIAVAEGIKHVDRAENRIKATVRRAREKLEESGIDAGALEAEASHLYDNDGRGSEGPRLHAMPVSVAEDDPAPAPFPGTFKMSDLRRIRGA